MDIVPSTLIMGFCAGLIALSFMKTSTSSKLITILLGIGGAYLGEYLKSFAGFDNDGEISLRSPSDWIASIVGSVVLIFIYNKFIKKEA